MQADDGLPAHQRGLGEPLAQIQARGEQSRDRAIIRAFGNQGFQFADDLPVVPRPDVGLDPPQQRGRAQVLQLPDRGTRERQVRHIGQRPTAVSGHVGGGRLGLGGVPGSVEPAGIRFISGFDSTADFPAAAPSSRIRRNQPALRQRPRKQPG
jgi:hypothetical protein